MSPEEIQATIQRANEYAESIKAKGQKVQMAAIYHKAFLERWGVQYLEQQEAEQADAKKKIAAKKQQDTLERNEKEKAEQTTLEKKARYQQAFDNFLILPLEQQDKIKTEFMKITDAFTLKKIKESQAKGDDYFSSTLVIQNFKSFLINS
jgi:hypothetical protein